MYVIATSCMCLSEEKMMESVLSFYHVGTEDRIQVVRLGSMYFTHRAISWP